MNKSLQIKFLSLCVIACLSVPSGMAFAGDPAAAAQFYQQASLAYQDGDYAEAALLLEKAYARDQNLIYKYNEILAYQAMGKFDEALRILDAYEGPMIDDPQQRFTDIKQIHTQISTAKAQADAKAQAEAKAKAKAKAKDQQDHSDKSAQADKSKDGSDMDAQDSVIAPPEKGPNILGWSLVGVGAVGLATAGLFGSTLLITDVEDRLSCTEHGSLATCYPDAKDKEAQYTQDQDTWSTHQSLTWVSLGVGVVALVGGGLVLYLDSQDETAPDMSAASDDDAQVSVAPYMSTDGAGGVLHISF